MNTRHPSRRTILKSAAAMSLVYATPLRAAAPLAQAVTPALVAAATKEGQVTWYTSADLQLAEKVGKAFEQKFSGIRARVERAGGERIFSRVAQEYAAGLHVPDAVSTGDAAQFIAWKRSGLLAAYVPDDVVKHIPAEHRDPDGHYATVRSSLCVMAYNTQLVNSAEAPKSFADLLDPKWKSKIVKAHPSYSGTIMTATYQLVRDLGWPFFEKLSQQIVMQVQSASDPPKKLALGERAVQADGNEYNLFQLREAGQPVEPLYATEGTPLVVGPNGIFKNAPNPNAARLFQSYCFSAECQQLVVDVGGLRSVHPQTREKAGRKPFKEINTLKDDAEGVEKHGEEIK